jgi:hypothetical protein
MKPRRSPERDPSFTGTDEKAPRWPWEQPPTPEETEAKEEPPKQSEQNKKPEKRKYEKEKPPDKSERPERVKTEKEQNEEGRRVSLLERSLALTKQFEEAPVPNDPHLVARLMIAKRVVAVNEQLETPPVDRSKPDEEKLLLTLNYLGDLSDKFEDPDAEASPEIEKIYETILQLATEALTEEEPEVLIEYAEDLSQSESETILSEPQPASSPATLPTALPRNTHSKVRTSIASLPVKTIALLKLLFPKRQKASLDSAEPTLTESESGGDFSGPVKTPRPENVTSFSRPHTVEHHQTESHTPPLQHLAKQEHFPGRSLPVVAPVILGALALGSKSSPSSAEIHRPITAAPEGSHYHGPAHEQPIRSKQRYEPLHKATPHDTRHEPAAPSPELLAQPSHELRKTTTAPEVVNASLSAQKFEFMSLHSLLDAATHVSIGHGEYLRRAYEKGHIDKAGLINVLKANAKGRDFIAEYRHQADRTRRLKMTSPEFLRSQPNSDDNPSALQPETSDPTPSRPDPALESPLRGASPIPRSSPESVSRTLDMLKNEKMPSRQTWPAGAHPLTGVWIAIGAVATIIVALITTVILTLI